MKLIYVVFSLIFNFLFLYSMSQVGIGTKKPVGSALLELKSVSKGFLPPRMSYAQRNFILNPEAGLIVWCNDCGDNGQLQVFNGLYWTDLIGSTALIPSQNKKYYAYVFPEPLESSSSTDLGSWMYDNGSTAWFGINNSGYPGNNQYFSNDLNTYVHFPGWRGDRGKFITNVESFKGLISQVLLYSDYYGCPIGQYTFSSINLSYPMIDKNLQYGFLIFIPLNGVGSSMNNMTVDIGTSACANNLFPNFIPPSDISAKDVIVTEGGSIPAGVYRVLSITNFQPQTSFFFRGASKY